MKAMHAYAREHSGITKEESEECDRCPVSIYSRLGSATMSKVSHQFYNRVYADELWFRKVFSASTREEAIANQRDFLIERFGGPKVYSERKGGRLRLMGRHAPYDLNPKTAQRWLEHMEAALDDVKEVDDQTKGEMMQYFKHTAHLLVASKSFTNCTHLIDYHNRMSMTNGGEKAEVVGGLQAAETEEVGGAAAI
ncbi:unnamed protein product [Chrysoparadoxa australica]